MHALRHVASLLSPLCRPGKEGGDLGPEFCLVGRLVKEVSGENAQRAQRAQFYIRRAFKIANVC